MSSQHLESRWLLFFKGTNDNNGRKEILKEGLNLGKTPDISYKNPYILCKSRDEFVREYQKMASGKKSGTILVYKVPACYIERIKDESAPHRFAKMPLPMLYKDSNKCYHLSPNLLIGMTCLETNENITNSSYDSSLLLKDYAFSEDQQRAFNSYCIKSVTYPHITYSSNSGNNYLSTINDLDLRHTANTYAAELNQNQR